MWRETGKEGLLRGKSGGWMGDGVPSSPGVVCGRTGCCGEFFDIEAGEGGFCGHFRWVGRRRVERKVEGKVSMGKAGLVMDYRILKVMKLERSLSIE